MKKKMTKILRFRLTDEIVDVLNKLPRKSEFVRNAIREKMERKRLIKKVRLPF